jgi:hypothetical protein
MKLPLDPTPEEVEIYDVMLRRTCTSQGTPHLYALLDDPIDKFLLAYVFELGNTRKSAQVAVKLSKVPIWRRIKRIKAVLEGYGISNHLLKAVDNMKA